ncbi:hypothetical protein [Caenimonas koreensis]|uniref:Uncharacterized protein n=1 Tax=Caenimonas koreensis DSM 17982 TaxID=1121255 RepID=A0A844AWH5_9BURK|nr:hypothetical protein [Caenimonas koreensis]MRD48725.1 hypothetical protein [Caenimonas koreensis DSM 17982]
MPKPRQPEDEQLTTEEIEAILERENAVVPEQPLAEHRIVQHEPGQGKFGKWAVWLIIAFILMGALQSMR